MGGGNDAVSKERGGQVRQAKAVSLGWFVLRPRRFVWVQPRVYFGIPAGNAPATDSWGYRTTSIIMF